MYRKEGGKVGWGREERRKREKARKEVDGRTEEERRKGTGMEEMKWRGERREEQREVTHQITKGDKIRNMQKITNSGRMNE